jgi:hypothetical protein
MGALGMTRRTHEQGERLLSWAASGRSLFQSLAAESRRFRSFA